MAPSAAGPSAGGAATTVTPGTDISAIPQLSSSEARALIELVTARGIAQGELAGLLGLVYLTAEGGVVATRVWNGWHSRQLRILAALSAEERAGLAAGLRGLVRGLAAEGLLGDVPPVPQARSAAPAESPAPALSPAPAEALSPAPAPAEGPSVG